MAVKILPRPAAAPNWASREYAQGRRERKVGAILHWMAGYLPGTTALFQNPDTGYATNLGVGSADGWGNGLEVHRYVPADGYAYGSYNAYADRRGESIEIENDRTKPYPGKPTPAVHELVAQLLAQLCVEEDWPLIDGKRQLVLGDFPDHRFYQKDIPGFGVEFNVTTHRSMALKDCPGTTEVQWLVNRGNEILSGAPTDQTGDNDMRYINVIGGGSATVGEFSFTPYSPESHGDATNLYRISAGAAWSGIDVDQASYNALRQDALNRRAAFLADVTAASAGIDPAVLKATVLEGVKQAIAESDPFDDIDVAAIVHGAADELGKRITNG